jgi:hypothetical protein
VLLRPTAALVSSRLIRSSIGDNSRTRFRIKNPSFSDDLPAIRGRPALIRPHQSEIAVTEFKALESRKT